MASEKAFHINERVTSDPLHLILEDGRSAGTVSLDQAKYLAQEYELDLVEISPKAIPPVAKLMDYNKFRYQIEKQARTGVKAKNPQLKEVRLSYQIDEHDLEIKVRQAQRFLDEGNFVRVFLKLRGRENVFAQKAKGQLSHFCELAEASVEQMPQQEGKRLQMIIKPKK